MDITQARINATVEAAEHTWMLDHCPTYPPRVAHGLIVDVDDRYAAAIVVAWIGPEGLQPITYALPAARLVDSTKPAPPLTVQIRRHLTDPTGRPLRDEPLSCYYTATEALFWLTSWSRVARSALAASQADDPDNAVPGAFTVTVSYADHTEVRYLAALPIS